MTLHWYSEKKWQAAGKLFLGFATQGNFFGGINFIFFKSGVETGHMTQRQCSWLDFFSSTLAAWNTVDALLTDTLISGQLYLRPLSQNTIVLSSHTNSAFLHSQKQPALVKDTFFTWQGCPLMRASTVITKWLPGNLKINIVCYNKQDTSLGIWQSNPALCRALQLIPVWQSYTIILLKIAFCGESVSGEEIWAVTIFCSFEHTGLSYLEEKDNLWILLLQKKKVAQVVVKET